MSFAMVDRGGWFTERSAPEEIADRFFLFDPPNRPRLFVGLSNLPDDRAELVKVLTQARQMLGGAVAIDPAVVKVVETALSTRANVLGQMAAAFIAQTGCPPDEVELVERVIHDEVAYSFRRKPKGV